jgi:hypothetical protein
VFHISFRDVLEGDWDAVFSVVGQNVLVDTWRTKSNYTLRGKKENYTPKVNLNYLS